MNLPGGFARVMEGDEVGWLEGFLCDRVDIIVLPEHTPSTLWKRSSKSAYALEPRYDTD